MSRPQLEDAFGHHVWATLRLIDTCLALTPEQLEADAPGTYGSILKTMRHLVGGDSWYLLCITDDRNFDIDEAEMGLAELRAVMETDGAAWSALLAGDPDPETVVSNVDEDEGIEQQAPLGIRLAQAVHHGTDHRSQICTALTSLGVEPPAIDLWDFGVQDGRVVEGPLSTA